VGEHQRPNRPIISNTKQLFGPNALAVLRVTLVLRKITNESMKIINKLTVKENNSHANGH
jgi:hypothetical protein